MTDGDKIMCVCGHTIAEHRYTRKSPPTVCFHVVDDTHFRNGGMRIIYCECDKFVPAPRASNQ